MGLTHCVYFVGNGSPASAKIYPYLLRGVVVTPPNQVWSTDLTYIRLPRGFVYLVTVNRLVFTQSTGTAVIEYAG
ncbi:MAG: hypothetical protein H0X43_10535 [Nitrosospira sp.]|nr:hypothetical protein [Nitrosospira sp.]